MTDTDIQQAHMNADGDAISRARRGGHCSHTSLSGPEDAMVCECGRIFGTYEAASAAIRDVIDGIYEEGPNA
jgi:hypothetical protein